MKLKVMQNTNDHRTEGSHLPRVMCLNFLFLKIILVISNTGFLTTAQTYNNTLWMYLFLNQ